MTGYFNAMCGQSNAAAWAGHFGSLRSTVFVAYAIDGGTAVGVRVDVVSDVICPWCFIGKRRLEKALRTIPSDVETQVVWHPFELNPEMPREGIDRHAYRQAKFGSPEASRALDARLAAA